MEVTYRVQEGFRLPNLLLPQEQETHLGKYLKLQRQMFRKSERELTRAEYQRLLDAAQARGDIRLLLLLETLCATGIRVSELQYITVEAAHSGVAEIALKGKLEPFCCPQSCAESC